VSKLRGLDRFFYLIVLTALLNGLYYRRSPLNYRVEVRIIVSTSFISLSEWLSEINFSEPKKDVGNHFTSFRQDKGTISIRTVDRVPYQPYVNCVKKDNFDLHKAVTKDRGYNALYYVIYLQGNGIQLIIPGEVVERNIKGKWFVVPLEKVRIGEPPLPGVVVRMI
jgi:hypothetical protein